MNSENIPTLILLKCRAQREKAKASTIISLQYVPYIGCKDYLKVVKSLFLQSNAKIRLLYCQCNTPKKNFLYCANWAYSLSHTNFAQYSHINLKSRKPKQ